MSAAGQTRPGRRRSLPSFSLSGPGELDLFGQVMATSPQFAGPDPPALQLNHITIDAEVAQMLRAEARARLS